MNSYQLKIPADKTFVDARTAAIQRLNDAHKERGFVLVAEVYEVHGPKAASGSMLAIRSDAQGQTQHHLSRQVAEIRRLGCHIAFFGPPRNGPKAAQVEQAWLAYVDATRGDRS